SETAINANSTARSGSDDARSISFGATQPTIRLIFGEKGIDGQLCTCCRSLREPPGDFSTVAVLTPSRVVHFRDRPYASLLSLSGDTNKTIGRVGGASGKYECGFARAWSLYVVSQSIGLW